MTRPLAGKTALVTGGSRGIGAAIVRRLAHGGAQVAFTYARSGDLAGQIVQEVADAGGRALAVQADNGDPEAVRAAVARTVEDFGGLDILVNSAGTNIAKPVGEVTPEDFDTMVAVSLRGPYALIQAALAHLPAGGRIINIGSIWADHQPLVVAPLGLSLYTMTRAAIAGLTRSLAQELGPRGITVNNVQPGTTRTDLISDRLAETMLPTIPVGRLGEPAEIAGVVAYLAGPDAGFVNGVSWNVDGGYLT
ncbi:oxidoreductase [Actinomadura craniellae]|uniref:Oxidoreductase n=1 Tax=Actinomadura craniellae TaxID=2231787 RepID=A0A365GVX3_9ACTN|nr:3-oxoacyl-ACP reductase family protein [Actinomadura craniellae]RAY10935.1 oxidoreductase [Actinomadura craniellae]